MPADLQCDEVGSAPERTTMPNRETFGRRLEVLFGRESRTVGWVISFEMPRERPNHEDGSRSAVRVTRFSKHCPK